jgi:multidrug transporter EmrE-like cation transporter
VFMAQAVSRKLFAQSTSAQEYCGMGLIVAGVAAVMWAAG